MLNYIRNLLRRVGLLAHEEYDHVAADVHKAIARFNALAARKSALESAKRETAEVLIVEADHANEQGAKAATASGKLRESIS